MLFNTVLKLMWQVASATIDRFNCLRIPCDSLWGITHFWQKELYIITLSHKYRWRIGFEDAWRKAQHNSRLLKATPFAAWIVPLRQKLCGNIFPFPAAITTARTWLDPLQNRTRRRLAAVAGDTPLDSLLVQVFGWSNGSSLKEMLKSDPGLRIWLPSGFNYRIYKWMYSRHSCHHV